VCFNRKLAEHLQRRTLHEKITIRHFHGLVSEVCLKAFHQFEVPPNAGPEFWVEEVAQMLQDALEELPDYRFDAIIVDEGQDFHTDWFIVLEDAHRRSPGPIYVFFDRAQNLYSKDLRFPDTETKYRLGKNCRNTKKIAGACEKTIGETIKVAAFSPEGEPPEIVSYRDDQELSSLVVRELDRCLKQEKLSPSRVAVLTHVKPERSALGTGKIGNHTTTDDLDIWQSGKAVWFSTIKAFKGLEADVLLLVGVPEIDTRHFTKSDLYVASSRARLRLLVYSNAQEVRDLLS
jgi:superfamily I DNA/RNA helicase